MPVSPIMIAFIVFVGGEVAETPMPRDKCQAMVMALLADGEVYATDRESSLSRRVEKASCRELLPRERPLS